jgi:ABC-2 type transport system ATP-binding protein
VTLFVTTHYMEEASNCSRLAFMYAGKVIAEGTPRGIRRDLQTRLGLEREPSMEDVFVELVQAQR